MPRSESRLRTWATLAATVGLASSVWASEGLRVSTLTREGQLLVSLELAGAYTDAVRATIQSGLQTTFRYDVELRRAAAFWPDPTLGSATLAATVRYDNLTQQYRVARLLDGHVEETLVVEEEDDVRELLTRFERVPLFSTSVLEPNAAYLVRVLARTRPRNTWFVWPWPGAAASGAASFTFLP